MHLVYPKQKSAGKYKAKDDFGAQFIVLGCSHSGEEFSDQKAVYLCDGWRPLLPFVKQFL